MRALVLHGDFDLRVEDRPDLHPGPGEVLITVIATGICGSDFHGYSGENGRRHPGQVMGHETVGTIAAVADDVADLPVGRLVTVNPLIACGTCAACAAGSPQHCPQKKVIGVAPEISAAFADQLVVPAGNVVPLAEDLPAELGALVEPLAVGYHAARRGEVGPGDRVLVLGGGAIGQACVLAARRLGVDQVAVSDPVGARRDLCAALGADALDPGDGDLANAVPGVLGGRPTVVIDAVGVSASMADALTVAGPGARIVLVGMGSPRLDLAAYALSTEERSVVGSFTYSPREFADTAAWVGTRPVGVERLIEGRVGFEDAAQSFDDLAHGRSTASKILVFPAGPPG